MWTRACRKCLAANAVKGSLSGHQDTSPSSSSCTPGQKHFGSRLNTIRDVFVAILLKFCQPQWKTEVKICYLIAQVEVKVSVSVSVCASAHNITILDSDKPSVWIKKSNCLNTSDKLNRLIPGKNMALQSVQFQIGFLNCCCLLFGYYMYILPGFCLFVYNSLFLLLFMFLISYFMLKQLLSSPINRIELLLLLNLNVLYTCLWPNDFVVVPQPPSGFYVFSQTEHMCTTRRISLKLYVCEKLLRETGNYFARIPWNNC